MNWSYNTQWLAYFGSRPALVGSCLSRARSGNGRPLFLRRVRLEVSQRSITRKTAAEGGINSHRSLGLLWTFVEHESGKMHLESGASGRRGTPAGTGPEKIRCMILKTDTVHSPDWKDDPSSAQSGWSSPTWTGRSMRPGLIACRNAARSGWPLMGATWRS